MADDGKTASSAEPSHDPAHGESKSAILGKIRAVNPSKFDPDVDDGDDSFKQLYDTDDERKMLEELRENTRGTVGDLADHDLWPLACLRGRKYKMDRAIEALAALKDVMDRYDIVESPPEDDAAVQDLMSRCVMKAYGNTDNRSRVILIACYGHINFHHEDRRCVLRATYLAVERMLRDYPRAQVDGMTLFADLSLLRAGNFDSSIRKEQAQMFTKTFPVRIGYMLYWNMPWYVRVVLPVVRLFLKKKIRERLHTVSHSNIHKFIDQDQLFTCFGGDFEADIPDYSKHASS